eukprot:Skav206707  [mRNA]  locus=scaffold99:224737:226857:+ [translate_table: standard]
MTSKIRAMGTVLLFGSQVQPFVQGPRHRSAMGRVRTKTVKKAARVIVEKYYGKLTLDFQEVATIPSKRLRNKIAGFTTHLMKRTWVGIIRRDDPGEPWGPWCAADCATDAV